MFDAYIFDFDLTLADTAAGIIICCNHALVQMGHLPALPEDIFVCIGKTVEETYYILTKNNNQTDAVDFHERWREKANEIGNSGTTLFSDTIDVLTQIKAADKKIAIVSNKTSRRIESVLRDFGIDEKIDLILGAELHNFPKPHPCGLLTAIEKLGTEAEKTLYIGDSLIDMETANNAEVAFAAVTTGPVDMGDFRTAGAENVFVNLTAVADLFLHSRC